VQYSCLVVGKLAHEYAIEESLNGMQFKQRGVSKLVVDARIRRAAGSKMADK
jgi:hypothetical protein